MRIKSLHAIEILDSRGNPTVRAFVELENGQSAEASVPSGASTGSHEAVELRDHDPKRYQGKGVLTAIEHINTTINRNLTGQNIDRPDALDQKMIELDGTENKERLGANAILAVSLALHRAAAAYEELPLWKFLHALYFSHLTPTFPRLMMNIVNGGLHANWDFDIQEFMVIPTSPTPSVAVKVGAEIYHMLQTVLKEKNLSTLVGDEGGFSPLLSSNENVLSVIETAAKLAGYAQEHDYEIGLDLASSDWIRNGKYILHKTRKEMSQEDLITYYLQLKHEYHIFSFEDPFGEDDWESWKRLTGQLKTALIIGDDLYTTNVERLKKGILNRSSNGLLFILSPVGCVIVYK